MGESSGSLGVDKRRWWWKFTLKMHTVLDRQINVEHNDLIPRRRPDQGCLLKYHATSQENNNSR